MVWFLSFFWCWQGSVFEVQKPEETYFAGPTDFAFTTTVQTEDLIGIELFIDGESVIYWDQPPFETTIDMRRYSKGLVKFKAVLSRFDGDDLRIEFEGTNDPNFIESDVHLVRVPVYVEFPDGENNFDLKKLEIFEDNTKQELSYYYGIESPLHLTVVLDLSGSMERRLLLLRRGVLRLLEHLKPGDGIEIIGFNHGVFQVSEYETDFELVRPRLNRMRAEGYTNLFGAVWSGLKIVGKSKQRRAMILFTDGYHELEGTPDYYNHDLEDCLELAREKGVPIYAMGMGSNADKDVLEKLGGESGGKTFLINSKGSVEASFEEIGQKLRRQFLLCYYTNSRESGWRNIEVKYSRTDPEVKLQYPKKLYFR